MDFNELHEAVTVSEVAFDGCSEHPVDLDFTLPDYCPDISRILKCQVIPRILGHQISNDALSLEGVTSIRLLYVGEGSKCVRSYNYAVPFSMVFPLTKTADSPVVRTKVKVEYVNCRAISQRRVDIHGAFSVCAKVYVRRTEHMIVDAKGAGIQLRRCKSRASSIIGSVDRHFTVSETLHISQNNAPIEQIIMHNTVAVIRDMKTISNKILTKGELLIKVLYASDLAQGLMETTEHSIPISQIIDLEGVDENSMCDVRFEVTNEDISTKFDSDGQNRMLSVEVKITAYARAFKDMEISMITDAYSTQYELAIEKKPAMLEKIAAMVKESHTSKQIYEFPDEELTRIIDLWCEVQVASVKEEKDGFKIIGDMLSCMLALDSQENPVYFERKSEFSYTYEMKNMPSMPRIEADAVVVSTSYNITGANSIEIRCEMKIDAVVYAVFSQHTISSLQPDENKPLKKDKAAALTIYYADPGENIWDIARKYNTSVADVMEENNLTSEELDSSMMLMIPNY